MSSPGSTRARSPSATVRLQDLALSDRDSVFHAPRGGDWLVLALLIVVLIGNGLYVWHQFGWDSRPGRAIFFGLALVCLFWSALVYTFKLSVNIRVGPHGFSLVRGPWNTQLTWAEISRLVERSESGHGRRYRWVVAMARDGRRLQVREDMVTDYLRFRAEVYERYRLWRDHGGTWGTTGGGPFGASDDISGDFRWWVIGGTIFLLPGLYFWLLLGEETVYLGPALTAVAAFCFLMALRALFGRQTYSVDARAITAQRLLGLKNQLTWRDVGRVDRTRHPVGGVMELGIWLGRATLALAARGDSRFQSFQWSPRVPEYLILRGGGRHVRIRLHRLSRPDEMLAWVEFYERIGRRGNAADRLRARAASSPQPGQAAPDDLTGAAGPADPWGSGRAGTQTVDGPQVAATQAGAPGVASGPLAGMPMPNQPANGSRSAPFAQPDWLAQGQTPAASGLDNRDQNDAWLWDTSAMPQISGIGYAPQPSQPVRPSQPSQPARPPQPSQPAHPAAPEPSSFRPQASMPTHDQSGQRAWAPPPMPPMQPPMPPMSPMSPPQAAPPPQHQQPPVSRPLAPHASAPDVPEVTPELYVDEVDPDQEDVPTDSIEGLADHFAPWQNDNWQPPQLPRFGPEIPGEPEQSGPWSRRRDEPGS